MVQGEMLVIEALARSSDPVSGPGTSHSRAGIHPSMSSAGGRGARNNGTLRPVGSNTYWPGQPATATGVPSLCSGS